MKIEEPQRIGPLGKNRNIIIKIREKIIDNKILISKGDEVTHPLTSIHVNIEPPEKGSNEGSNENYLQYQYRLNALTCLQVSTWEHPWTGEYTS